MSDQFERHEEFDFFDMFFLKESFKLLVAFRLIDTDVKNISSFILLPLKNFQFLGLERKTSAQR